MPMVPQLLRWAITYDQFAHEAASVPFGGAAPKDAKERSRTIRVTGAKVAVRCELPFSVTETCEPSQSQLTESAGRPGLPTATRPWYSVRPGEKAGIVVGARGGPPAAAALATISSVAISRVARVVDVSDL